jgi:hypothetical protein
MNDADILDVLPTAFHLLDWPVPNDLDGKVRTEILDKKFRKVGYGEPTPAMVRDPREYAEQERAAILAQLKALGYFG